MKLTLEMKPELEFGELETKFNDTYLDDDCVEFPSSWPVVNRSRQSNGHHVESNATTPHKTSAVVKTKTLLTACKQSESITKVSKKSDVDSMVQEGCEEKNIANTNDSSSLCKEPLETHVDVSPEVAEDLCIAGDESPTVNKHEENEAFDQKSDGKVDPTAINQSTVTSLSNGCSGEGDVLKIKDKTQKGTTSWAGVVRSKEHSSKSIQSNGYVEPQAQKSELNKINDQTIEKSSAPSHISPPQCAAAATKENQIKTETKTPIIVIEPKDDENASLYAEKLLYTDLIFKPQAFIPRGLINTNNWCFINATLQALLVCPPFYQLLKSLPVFKSEQRVETSTPIMDCFIKLASEFRPLSTKRGYQSSKQVRHGPPFQPSYVYDMLSAIKSSLSEKGKQEDAEEFLSCILNGIHEEMKRLFHYYNETNEASSTPNESDRRDHPSQNSVYDVVNGSNEDLDEWEEVGKTKRNRNAVTRRADISRTPISEMFRGELCTTVFRPGRKPSISYEPFFALPLDVPCDHPWTVDDALYALTEREHFIESDSEIDAFRQQSIQVLPPVLILHLKRFVYNKTGGSKKIDRKMDFKTDLVIGKELLSKSSRKHYVSQRSYKLFAVVYHHGEEMTGGHYTTDVFHIGLSSWLRIDDQNIWAVPHNEVIRHNSKRTPYLLYYRRTDLG